MVLTNTAASESDKDICSQLHKIAGVRLSQEWLTACRVHLQEHHHHHHRYSNNNNAAATAIQAAETTTTTTTCTADAVLFQVLHSDLRDVVDRSNDDGILRKALCSSQSASAAAAVALPESFALMVQVEELLDVSLNAEARLAVGPASSRAAAPIGNQSSRCLKLYLSDGYHHCNHRSTTTCRTKATANHNYSQQHLVAMEQTPLADLSVNSKAGIKLILKGPMTCRFGVMMLNPGNAVVLGGNVEHLVEMQQKALEQAKRYAGVGVDSTIKALCWNPQGAEEGDDNEDEDERESGDVQAAAPQQPPPPPPPPLPPTVPRHVSQPASQATRPVAAIRPALPPSVQQQVRNGGGASSFSAPQFQGSRTGENPYAATSSNASSIPLSEAPSSAYSRPTPSTSSASAVFSRPTPSVVSTSNAVVDLCMDDKDGHEPMTTPQVLDLTTPTTHNSMLLQGSAVPRPAAPPSQETSLMSQETSTTRTSHTNTATGTTLDTEPLSFSELKALIAKLQTDEQAYRQYETKVFVVPCKMIGHHQYFDIDKKKKKKRDRKNKDDKYDFTYAMTVNMGGTDASDGTLLCSVASDILRTNFVLEASEMRNLQKTEPEKCGRLVQEGGLKIKASLVTLSSWHLKLVQSATDFFESKAKNDGSKPILQLVRRD